MRNYWGVVVVSVAEDRCQRKTLVATPSGVCHRYSQSVIFGLLRKMIFTILAISFFFWDSPSLAASDRHTIIHKVSKNDDLPNIVDSAEPGSTILLEDGTYRLNRPLVFRKPDVWIRSKSGDRNRVILDGKMDAGELKRETCINDIIAVRASNVTVADLSIRHARDHGIHISPQGESNITNVVMHDIHVYDCGQQLIKVNSNGMNPLYWADEGILEDSLIEFIDNSIMQDIGHSFYTGGIDVHGGKDWRIRRNVFRNIQRDGKMMEHAVHMWSSSRGTVVEQNRFVNCYRAIGFGMKTTSKGLVREYPDGKGAKSYFDHIEGIVQNNFIFNRRGIHLETGIELMNVIDVKVYHNTVVSQDKPFSSIEYRWPNTRAEIANNIVSHRIIRRDGAQAILRGNIESAPRNLFKDYKMGNLHLSSDATPAVNNGVPLKDTGVREDFDGDERDGRPDIGADERRNI